jgi:putative intracellular protease/amidase
LKKGRVITHFHENNKPIGAICHGPAALLSTKLLNQGQFPFEGYRITCFSNLEEKSIELMWFDKLKWYQENALKEMGAVIRKKLPMIPNVVLDRELVTGNKIQKSLFLIFAGQGPTSANKFSRTFVNHLFKYNPKCDL